MEAIQASYGSDSDSDIDVEPTNKPDLLVSRFESTSEDGIAKGDQQHKKDLKPVNTCDEIREDVRDCFTEGQQGVDQSDDDAGTTDYFGLTSTDLDVDNSSKEIVDNRCESVTLQGEKVNLEIPNTGFWSELNTAELQSLQTTSIPERPNKRLKHECEMRKLAGHEKEGSGTKTAHIQFSPSFEKSEVSEKHRNQTDLTHHKSHSPRKLFYVHSKIKPFLHSNRNNSVPSKQEWTRPAHAGAINRVKWNVPEYSHLLTTCSMDSTIKLWNIWTQLDPCLSELTVHDKAVRDIDWNQTGKQLLSCSFDKTAKVTDVEKGVRIHNLPHDSFVTCGKYHPGLSAVCVTGCKDKIYTWDLRTPQSAVKTFMFKDPMGQIQDLVFSRDHGTLFSSSDLISRDSSDRNMVAWDWVSGATLSNQIYQERYILTRLKVHPVDRTLLAQSYGNYVAIFSTDRPYKMFKNKRFEGHKLLGYSIGFDITSDGSCVYSGSSDGTVYCYNYQSGKQYRTLKTLLDVVMDLACHPVLSSTIAVCGWDGTLQVWR